MRIVKSLDFLNQVQEMLAGTPYSILKNSTIEWDSSQEWIALVVKTSLFRKFKKDSPQFEFMPTDDIYHFAESKDTAIFFAVKGRAKPSPKPKLPKSGGAKRATEKLKKLREQSHK